jgi:hypothetical protein
MHLAQESHQQARDNFKDAAVQTIAEFCRDNKICRSMLYHLWKRGIGPRVIKIGRKNLISAEAAEQWRREREQATPNSGGVL